MWFFVQLCCSWQDFNWRSEQLYLPREAAYNNIEQYKQKQDKTDRTEKRCRATCIMWRKWWWWWWQKLPSSTQWSGNKLSIWDNINFCLSNKAEQFAQFIVPIYQLQLVQERRFHFSNQSSASRGSAAIAVDSCRVLMHRPLSAQSQVCYKQAAQSGYSNEQFF